MSIVLLVAFIHWKILKKAKLSNFVDPNAGPLPKAYFIKIGTEVSGNIALVKPNFLHCEYHKTTTIRRSQRGKSYFIWKSYDVNISVLISSWQEEIGHL
jgi:hypothetical protein